MIDSVHAYGVDGIAPASSLDDAGAPARPRSRRPARAGRSALRWASHVVFLLAWILIAVMATLMWGPHLTKYKTDIIVGQSMEPTIPLYSVIIVEPVKPGDIRRGDVITYEQPDVPGRKVTHRVAEVDRAKDGTPIFRTKGDNNPARDPYETRYDDTGWRVRTHVPHVGWLMLQAQTRGARIALVAAPVLIVLVMFLRWLWRPEDDDVNGDEW